MTLNQRLVWWIFAFLIVTVAAYSKDAYHVRLTDPRTQERYQALKPSNDHHKPYLVGDSNQSNRFSRAYLDALANQCNDVMGPRSLFEFLNHTSIAISEFCFNPQIYPYSFGIYWLLFESIQWDSYLAFAWVAVGFTIARYFCTKAFLKTTIGQRFVTKRSQMKAVTSLWNAILYAFLFSVEAAIVLNDGFNLFDYPLCIFKDIHYSSGYFDDPIPWQYRWLYMFQIGFYSHASYVTLRLDARRKDTSVMLIHHALTIVLLSFSYFARFHKIGLLVLFLHDIADVFLELGKFAVAVRTKCPEHVTVLDTIAKSLFLIFAINWFYLRIYLYPIKVIYGTTWGVYLTHLDREAYFFLFFNVMLITLYLLQIYWSYFIVVMLCKMVLGRMPKLEDERDFELDTSSNGVCEQVMVKGVTERNKLHKEQ